MNLKIGSKPSGSPYDEARGNSRISAKPAVEEGVGGQPRVGESDKGYSSFIEHSSVDTDSSDNEFEGTLTKRRASVGLEKGSDDEEEGKNWEDVQVGCVFDASKFCSIQ